MSYEEMDAHVSDLIKSRFLRGRRWWRSVVSLIFDEGSQSLQSLLPLVGNAFEIRLELFERLQPELEPALASNPDVMHDTSALQYAKMLGDRLSC
jgi:hypothetical protein